MDCYGSVCRAIELFAQMEPLDAGCTRTRRLLQGLAKQTEASTTSPINSEAFDLSILDYLGTDSFWENIETEFNWTF